jgi:hypothetical protein
MSNETTDYPVWVNGKRYDSPKEAAEQVSLLLGWREVHASLISLSRDMYRDIVLGNVTISTSPPKTEKTDNVKTAVETPGQPVHQSLLRKAETIRSNRESWITVETPRAPARAPLLRYPPGESPMERGLPYVRR